MSGEQLEKIETLDGQQFGKAGQLEELVERLARAYVVGEYAVEDGKSLVKGGIRAVLAALAKMGADDALPSADDLGDITYEHADVSSRETLELYADHVRATTAPVLAAKDAELARRAEEIERLRAEAMPTDEQLAEEAARFAYGSDWWDSGATDEDKRQCAEKALQIIRGIHGPKTEHALAEAVRAYANGARRSWRRSG